MHVGVCRDQKVLDSLELELQAAVNDLMKLLGTRPRFSARVHKHLYL